MTTLDNLPPQAHQHGLASLVEGIVRDYYNNLPPHIRQHGLACGWLYQTRQGSEKPAKVPQNLQTGKPADPSNQNDFVPMSSLANFDYKKYGYDGIGLGIFGNICAIDIDHCIDDTGNYSPIARDIINTMQSYTEISPSGHGIRILFLATDFNYDKAKYYINNQKIGLEVYVAGATNKYVSLTGNAICKVDLVESGDLLQIVLDKYMLRPQHSELKVQLPVPTITLDDTALLEKACGASNGDKFTALFSGDTSEYGGDDSAADMALCNLLAFWTSRNAEQMDRLFRQSGLMRDKWDRPTGDSTYGQITIEKAIAGATQVYTPQTQTAATQPVAVQDPASDPATAVAPTVTYPVQVIPPKIISAVDLDKLTLPPLQVLVEGVLTAGTNILVGPSKARKSWLVLDMGLSIAAGNPWMGLPTKQCGVLYFALEDSLRRLQDRMRKVLNGTQPPTDFFFASELPTVDFGLFTVLDQYLQEHPSIKLIIIDTLQKVRGIQNSNANLYSYDYKDLSTFQKYALKRGITFLFVHHTRKTKDADDVFNNISGSTGIMGVADTIWMISKKREDMLANLHITGRDVYEQTLSISFNPETFRWESCGTVEESDEEKDRVIYKNSRVVKTVKKLLEFSTDGTWSGFASELIEKSTEYGINICATPQLVGKFLAKNDELFEEIDQISHWTTFANGQGSKKHHFRYAAYGDPTDGEQDDPTVDDPDEAYEDEIDEVLPYQKSCDSLITATEKGEQYEL